MATRLAELRDTYALDDLAADVQNVVGNETAHARIVATIEPLLARFLAAGNLPEQYCRHADGRVASAHQDFTLYRLHRGPQDCFNIMVAIWPPGGSSGVHDHAGNWVVEGVYRNALHTIRYEREDDGSVAGHAHLRVVNEADVLPGDVSHVRYPDRVVHDFINPTDQPTVSVHIYGGDISRETLNYFDPANDKVEQVAHDLKFDNEL